MLASILGWTLMAAAATEPTIPKVEVGAGGGYGLGARYPKQYQQGFDISQAIEPFRIVPRGYLGSWITGLSYGFGIVPSWMGPDRFCAPDENDPGGGSWRGIDALACGTALRHEGALEIGHRWPKGSLTFVGGGAYRQNSPGNATMNFWSDDDDHHPRRKEIRFTQRMEGVVVSVTHETPWHADGRWQYRVILRAWADVGNSVSYNRRELEGAAFYNPHRSAAHFSVGVNAVYAVPGKRD